MEGLTALQQREIERAARRIFRERHDSDPGSEGVGPYVPIDGGPLYDGVIWVNGRDRASGRRISTVLYVRLEGSRRAYVMEDPPPVGF